MLNSNVMHYIILDLIDEIKSEAIMLNQVYLSQESNLNSDNQIKRVVAQTSLASIVVKIYTKAEDIFSKIVKEFDGEKNTDNGWHASLLQQLKIKTNIRPAFFSLETFKLFDMLRKFRHVERNCYASEIIASEIPEKVKITLKAVVLLERDYKLFSDVMFGQTDSQNEDVNNVISPSN